VAWLAFSSLTVALGRRDIVRDAAAEVDRGELVAVVGPNGAGKTTLLRALAGLLAPRAGRVSVFGHDPARADRRAIARELAYVPQSYDLAFPFSVEEVVLLGRFAHQHGLGLASPADLAAAEAAMTACDVAGLARRRFDEISGGEARRVVLAQALCQGARLLLADEPTAGLDPSHARGVFTQLRAHARDGAVVTVTHDLDLALRHADRMWLVADGRLAAAGPPRDVLGSAAARAAFGLTIHIGALPDGTPFAVPA
jgi:iron complex transport system ATP-binding protein